MADLAKLVVKLEMQSAQLLKELDKSNAKLSQFERSTSAALSRLDKRFGKFGSSIKGAFGAILGGFTLKAIVDASAEAAKNFALLENAVAQAGEAAGGRTASDFARVSKELQSISTFSDDAIQNVQQLLLRFQSVRTDRFDDATKSVLNLSAALGTDLDSAAKLVGKALTDPEKGMTALARAGVTLSGSQQKLIKSLVEAGRSAEAQGVLLDALEEKYGGAAEAARNNFSGALTGVKNALNDLMEVDGGLPGATSSLNELAKTLADPAVRAGADALFSIIIRGAAAAAEFLGKTIAGLAILAGQGQDASVNLDNEIRDLTKSLEHLHKTNPFPDEFAKGLIDEKTEALKKLTDEYDRLQGLGVAGIGTAAKKPEAMGGSGAEILPDITTVFDDTLQKKIEAAGAALTDKLLTPLERYNKAVAEADRLLAANVITQETWIRALADARGNLEGFSNDTVEQLGSIDDMIMKLDESLLKFNEDLEGQIQASLSQMEPQIDAFGKIIDKQIKVMDEEANGFFRRASENAQDILGDGIYTAIKSGFDEGISGALDAFADMLLQLATQAAAAQIGQKLFGSGMGASGEEGGDGGWIGTLVGAIGSYFGGSRDSGGRGQAGVAYSIGTGAQPETFVPDTAGSFYPAGMGGVQVSQTFMIAAPQGSVSRQTQLQIGAQAAKGLGEANRRNN